MKIFCTDRCRFHGLVGTVINVFRYLIFYFPKPLKFSSKHFCKMYFNLVNLISVVLENSLITNLGPPSQVNKLPVSVSEGRSLAPLHSPRVRWETPLYVSIISLILYVVVSSEVFDILQRMIKHIITRGLRCFLPLL